MRMYLKNLREEKKLSQHEVAANMELSQQAYSLIENGERQQDMKIGIISKLAEIFEITPSEIIKMENEYQKTNKAGA